MRTQRSIRELLLEQAAVETAHAWIEEVRRELVRDCRELDGAWPGTLSEARARAGETFRRAALEREMPAPAPEELQLVAQLTTGEARRAWRKLVSRGLT
jgi:hypothetical protein